MEAGIEAQGEAKAKPVVDSVVEVSRASRPLAAGWIQKQAGSLSWADAVRKQGGTKASSQGATPGRKEHPFNFEMVERFQEVNPHHARAVHTTVAAIVGLGFQTPNDRKRKVAKQTGVPLDPEKLPIEDEVSVIDRLLSPLCAISWQDTINDVCEDYKTKGNGYLEVKRDEQGSIAGLYHIPAKEVFVVVEDENYNLHYEITNIEDASGDRIFAAFGDRDGLIERAEGLAGHRSGKLNKASVSEVIHFRRPSSLSRWYGHPDWLSAVASIELAQCVTQHEYDFFLNRGVPEFMLFVLGQKLHERDRAKIERAMQSTMGLGNQHKSLLVNLAGGKDSIQVQLEKLAMESKSDASQFSSLSETIALQIVTGHGVPPLLAGIQVPGKLGAANELVQAMQAFQVLVIGPSQRLFTQTLLWTLGQEPSLDLSAKDLVLNTITDEIDVGTADTMARMRQSPQEAEAEGRDLEDGLKKLDDEERGALLREAIDLVLSRLINRA